MDEFAQLLEGLGFTAIWTAEHHFFWDGWTSPVPTNPILFGAYIAPITKKLRIAQCGVCLPDWHPIRVAEDIAMVDHMSGGRVEFGALRGTNNRVNGNFNRHADRRNQPVSQEVFWETLEIIEVRLERQTVQLQGQVLRVPDAGMV